MAMQIKVGRHGGPEVLERAEVELGAPGTGEVRLRHTAIGLNFIDTYFRSGLYPPPSGLPFVPGLEGAGVVEAVGEDVRDLAVGQRVAYGTGPLGAYSTERLIPAEKVIAIPDAIPDEVAAAMMLKGLTAQYLLRRTYEVKPGDTILFHAAAGGVGLIACQWARALGATVIGTVGSPAKAQLAMAHGCHHVINYSTENFSQRVREITGGEGVAVVYDGVGKDTFMGSLDSLRTRGMMVSYGNASGPVPPVDLLLLSQKGALFITRPTLMHYTTKRADLEALGGELFDMVVGGQVRIEVNQTYALKDAAQAHRDLEARLTTGSTILLP